MTAINRVRRVIYTSTVITLLLSVEILLNSGVIQPDFLKSAQALNIVRLAAFLGIIAAGQTLVIISGGEGIDLSVGAVVTLGAILTFMIGAGDNSNIPLALAAVLGTGLLIGAINGLGIIFLRIPPLVMTLGMTGVIQGTILAMTQGSIPGRTPPGLASFINGRFLGLPGVIYLWLALSIILWLLLERTPRSGE